MRTPEERNVALECLKLAVTHHNGTGNPVESASEFYGFVTGNTDAHDTIDLIKRVISAAS